MGTTEPRKFLNRKKVQVIGLITRRSKFFYLYGSTCKHLNRARLWTVNTGKAWTKSPDFDISRNPVYNTACICYGICTVLCKRVAQAKHSSVEKFIWTSVTEYCNLSQNLQDSGLTGCTRKTLIGLTFVCTRVNQL